MVRSGTTAVCVLWHRTDKMLYIAWVGDSEALLASKGRVCPLVEPHKADRKVRIYLFNQLSVLNSRETQLQSAPVL